MKRATSSARRTKPTGRKKGHVGHRDAPGERAATTLSSEHAQQLAASGITAEAIAGRGYRTVVHKAELERLGFSPMQRTVPGLLIPLHSVMGDPAGHQYRPDEPRWRGNKPIKYETPKGSRMLLDVPPAVRPALGDPSMPLVVTEGTKKADAAACRGLPCVALLGVWNWRGTNDQGGKVALADWERVALKHGRRVYIAFDSDVMVKSAVHDALSRLKRFLESCGASASVIYLPPGAGGAKVGLDDFLVAGHSVAELLALAEPDVRPVPQSERDDRPYRLTDSGLIYVKRTSEGAQEIPLTNFGARIVADVTLDDGAEQMRSLELEVRLSGRTHTFQIPASRFTAMAWPVEQLGGRAIVCPGMGTRDLARMAIQTLSDDIDSRTIYRHTGWRHVNDEPVYLHGAGAIGADGSVPGVEVRLDEALSRYELPEPRAGAERVDAIRASLRMLDVAPLRITAPLLGAAYRAILGLTDFGVHLVGATGTGKTELAALVQQHHGAQMDARHLPAGWAATANALELLAFTVKDAVLVVDDFAPTGSIHDVARLHREADRLIRSQGNRSGRSRLTADSTLRQTKPPRGLVLSTGEDLPRGQSLRARLLVLEVGPHDVKWDVFTECQRVASAGHYAAATAAFVRWLAPQYETLRAALRAQIAELRATMGGIHKRTPDIMANLAIGLQLFLRFAEESGAITADEHIGHWGAMSLALAESAAAQAEHQASSEPAARFLALLSAALRSGSAHVAALDGGVPLGPAPLGWRDEGDERAPDWKPQGARVGWTDGEHLYLLTDSALRAVQGVARESGEGLSITSGVLRKRLHEKGLLEGTDSRGGGLRLEVRKVIEGKRLSVLQLAAGVLEPAEDEREEGVGANPGGPCGPFKGCAAPDAQNGPLSWATQQGSAEKVAHGVAHRVAHGATSYNGGGPDGPDGPRSQTPPSEERGIITRPDGSQELTPERLAELWAARGNTSGGEPA